MKATHKSLAYRPFDDTVFDDTYAVRKPMSNEILTGSLLPSLLITIKTQVNVNLPASADDTER